MKTEPDALKTPPAADPALPVAPAEPHPIKRSLWQRWMDWSGSFFVLSILLHVLLLGGATVLVVQVVQARKEKLKFTAPPPSAAGAVEHKVKPSKKMEAAVPTVSKRITSTAANASIALPAMNMSASTGPDVMASVMSGMGSGGLGAGAGGLASMPLTGLTAFGFKGGKGTGGAFRGYFTDFKQDKQQKDVGMNSGKAYTLAQEFAKTNFSQSVIKDYYRGKDPLYITQFYIPDISSSESPKAFGLEGLVKPSLWIVHYSARVIPPESGTYYFVGNGDDYLFVKFNGKLVLDACWQGGARVLKPTATYQYNQMVFPYGPAGGMFTRGLPIEVQGGKSYDMEVMIGDQGGLTHFCLLIEKQGVNYEKDESGNPILPLFRVARGEMPEPGKGQKPLRMVENGPVWKAIPADPTP